MDRLDRHDGPDFLDDVLEASYTIVGRFNSDEAAAKVAAEPLALVKAQSAWTAQPTDKPTPREIQIDHRQADREGDDRDVTEHARKSRRSLRTQVGARHRGRGDALRPGRVRQVLRHRFLAYLTGVASCAFAS